MGLGVTEESSTGGGGGGGGYSPIKMMGVSVIPFRGLNIVDW